MKKVVAENLSEWVSSNTGLGDYGIQYNIPNENRDLPSDSTHQPQLSTQDLSQMVPPPDMKLTPEEFNNYVNNLISMLPKSPALILEIFRMALKNHPYLTKTPIGYKAINLYKPAVDKFYQAVDSILGAK